MDSGFTPETVLKIASPVAPEPVKATLSIAGWATSARPVAPAPVTRLATPAGSFAASRLRNTSIAADGVYSDGFTTIVQPAASAAHSFQPMSSTG
jgi:hypothetical protein